MRIGIDARLIHYSQAGITQYTTHLVKALAKIDSEDQFFLLQSRKEPDPLVNHPNFRRKGLWTPSHHRLEHYILGLEVLGMQLDVLHSPDFIPPKRWFGSDFRSVITVHDLAFLLYPNFLTPQAARYYGQIDHAVRRADHIIAVSQSTKEDLIRLLGVPDRKITVIHEAANPIYRPINRDEAWKKAKEHYPNLPEQFFLFVGTLEPRKNIPALLRAYSLMRQNYKTDHVKLVLAGRPGWLFDKIFQLVQDLDLESHTFFLGRVPTEVLLYLYNSALALVHPAHYEGFGLPALEAMACGTPVITTRVSSLPEVVGDAALLVSPEDEEELAVQMWRILSDGDLRDKLRAKGLNRAASFSWEKTARETLEVYRHAAKA